MQGFTYEQLTDALQSWPRKASPQYLLDLDRIIQLAELRLIKELNIELFDSVESATVTAASRVVPKPAGLISTRTLFLYTAGVYTELKRRTLDYCRAYAPTVATTGTPQFWAELNDEEWYVVPTPSANATVEAHGPYRPESIVDVSNTWLGDNCGELLFSSCLMEAENWLKSDDRYADAEARHLKELQMWKLENRQLIKGGEYSPIAAAATKVG